MHTLLSPPLSPRQHFQAQWIRRQDMNMTRRSEKCGLSSHSIALLWPLYTSSPPSFFVGVAHNPPTPSSLISHIWIYLCVWPGLILLTSGEDDIKMDISQDSGTEWLSEWKVKVEHYKAFSRWLQFISGFVLLTVALLLRNQELVGSCECTEFPSHFR